MVKILVGPQNAVRGPLQGPTSTRKYSWTQIQYSHLSRVFSNKYSSQRVLVSHGFSQVHKKVVSTSNTHYSILILHLAPLSICCG